MSKEQVKRFGKLFAIASVILFIASYESIVNLVFGVLGI